MRSCVHALSLSVLGLGVGVVMVGVGWGGGGGGQEGWGQALCWHMQLFVFRELSSLLCPCVLGDADDGNDAAGPSELKREELDKPLGFSLGARARAERDAQDRAKHAPLAGAAAASFDEEAQAGAPSGQGGSSVKGLHKRSKLEELMEQDRIAQQRLAANKAGAAAAAGPQAQTKGAAAGKEVQSRTPWIAEGVVVKVLSKALKEHGYYKQKGVVLRVINAGFVGEIEMLDSGERGGLMPACM
jgi:hypothetical protein